MHLNISTHAFMRARARKHTYTLNKTEKNKQTNTETHAGEYTFTCTQKHTLGTENRQGGEEKRQSVRIR